MLFRSEHIIKSVLVDQFENNNYITIFTKNGMIKRTMLEEFKVTRYSKPITCIKLKDNDEVMEVTDNIGQYIFITTKNGFGLRYLTEEVSPIGLKTAGVKAVSLKNDSLVTGHVFDESEYLVVLTDKGTGKRIKMSEFEVGTRARKGIQMVRDVKTNPYSILSTFVTNNKINIDLKFNTDFKEIKSTDLPICDRYSTGTQITKEKIEKVFEKTNLEEKEELVEIEEKKVKVDLNVVDEKMMTIDDFLDDIKFKD